MVAVVIVIDNGSDPPDNLSVIHRQKRLAFGGFVERVFSIVEQFPGILDQRRNPVWVAFVMIPREANEGFLLSLCGNRDNRNGTHTKKFVARDG